MKIVKPFYQVNVKVQKTGKTLTTVLYLIYNDDRLFFQIDNNVFYSAFLSDASVELESLIDEKIAYEISSEVDSDVTVERRPDEIAPEFSAGSEVRVLEKALESALKFGDVKVEDYIY